MPLWERAGRAASHFLLYALMIALPVTGWVISSASNVPFQIFWTIPLPAITAPDKAVADLFATIHGWLVTLLARGAGRARRRGAAAPLRQARHRARRACFPGERREENRLALCCACSPARRSRSRRRAAWKMDPSGSKLEFIATFEKTAASGVFKEFDARLRFDPAKPAGGSLDVTVKVTSADMGIADVNKEIRNKDWFDYSAFPQAEFHSDRPAPRRQSATSRAARSR